MLLGLAQRVGTFCRFDSHFFSNALLSTFTLLTFLSGALKRMIKCSVQDEMAGGMLLPAPDSIGHFA